MLLTCSLQFIILCISTKSQGQILTCAIGTAYRDTKESAVGSGQPTIQAPGIMVYNGVGQLMVHCSMPWYIWAPGQTTGARQMLFLPGSSPTKWLYAFLTSSLVFMSRDPNEA